jgi:hypothetical protein
MLNLLIFFNNCGDNIAQMFGVYKTRSNTSGKLSFYSYIVIFSSLAGTGVFLFLFLLTDLFSLNLCTLFDVNVIYLAGTPFVKDDPFGKRASRRVHFYIPEESSSSSQDTPGPNFTAPPTAAAAVNEAQDKMDAAWHRACTEIKELLQKRPKGSKPMEADKTARRIRVRYNQLMNPEFTTFSGKSRRVILDIDSHVSQTKLNIEARKLDLKSRFTAYYDYQTKLAQDRSEFNFKLQVEARERRLQQAAEAGAARRFDLRSHLSKENTARHYFAGATNRNRASMHPKAKWPYDSKNNYIYYKGFTVPFYIEGECTPAETNNEFTQEFEKEDPFIHKSSPGGDELPSDEEGGPNIPGEINNTSLLKKLMGFVSHLAPYWVDINTPQGKLLFFLFFLIGLILIILGIRYLYYRFFEPLFNKNSKDSRPLKDTKL